MANVRVIPAITPVISAQAKDIITKRRVAAYARVSTDSDEKAIYDNARTIVNQSEWSERNNDYLECYRIASKRMDVLEATKRERLGKVKSSKALSVTSRADRWLSTNSTKNFGLQLSIKLQSIRMS